MRCLARSLVLVFALVLMPILAAAQTGSSLDYDSWKTLATQAEEMLDTEDATTSTLTELRADIVSFRTRFDAASELNAARIKTLREQIAALGPEPEGEDAEPESADVAAQRSDLNDQLSTVLVPVQQAEAAFVRADSLVSQIDQALRELQTEELLQIAPSPLNPAHWQRAVTDLTSAATALMQEPAEMGDISDRRDLLQTVPTVVIIGLLGLLLLLRGRSWSVLIVEQLRALGARGLGIWRFLISLLRVILPFGGVLLLGLAAIRTGLLGKQVADLLFFFALLCGVMLGLRWIVERVFSRDDDEALILVDQEQRTKMRFYVTLVTIFMAINEMLSRIVETGDPAQATVPVLSFPCLVLSAFALFKMGGILRSYRDTTPDDTVAADLRSSSFARVVRGFGTGALVVAVVSPLLLAAGYFKAADAILPPYFLTLAVLGLVMTLQRFAADIYSGITRQGVDGRDDLLPVLIGMVLVFGSLPFLGLIWGMRVTDLTELWSAFGRGISIGDSQVSPGDFLVFAVIFAIGYFLTRIIQSALKSNVLPKTKMDIGGQNAIVSGLGYVGICLALLAAISGAGLDLSSLAIVAGALSVGIGFGLQNIVSNFISGIILLVERPISEGDWIEVGGNMGYVRDISVRSTRIETFDKTDVIVPNADLVISTVTNYTRGNTVGRLIVPVGVAYGNDTKRIEAILREIAEAQPMVLTTPPPNIFFLNFGADALEFEMRCILRDVNWMMVVKSNINHEIAKRFAEEGIEIPFAQRDLWLRNPEVLTGAKREAPPHEEEDASQERSSSDEPSLNQPSADDPTPDDPADQPS